jgi:hypothetical protein
MQTDNAQFAICQGQNLKMSSPMLTSFSKCVAATLYKDLIMFIAEQDGVYTVLKRIDVDYDNASLTKQTWRLWSRPKSGGQVLIKWTFPASDIAQMIAVPMARTGNMVIVMITKRGEMVQVPIECEGKEVST